MTQVSAATGPELAGERRRLRTLLAFLGPAFIAAVAYVDPGNFATNMAGGAQFGYTLGWVVLAANLAAMLVQGLSAKLGIATGLSLPEVCRARLPHWAVVGLWLQAEAVAMATDLAEFTGAALGLHLVFGLQIWLSAALAGIATFAVLAMESRGYRRLEAVITGMVVPIALAFCLELFMARPSAAAVASGMFKPRLPGGAALLAVSIIGATVMPHVIYLHSALVRGRTKTADATARQRAYRYEMLDVWGALGLAGIINLAMLAVAASVFYGRGTTVPASLDQVVTGLNVYLGEHAGTVLGLALIVSGIASSSVGTMAGQVIMEGFIRRRVPVLVRRALTMLPALALLASGFDPTRALLLSQAALSFGIPFALIPLVIYTRDRALMGQLANSRPTNAAAILVTVVIVSLNIWLLATS